MPIASRSSRRPFILCSKCVTFSSRDFLLGYVRACMLIALRVQTITRNQEIQRTHRHTLAEISRLKATADVNIKKNAELYNTLSEVYSGIETCARLLAGTVTALLRGADDGLAMHIEPLTDLIELKQGFSSEVRRR